MMDNLKHLAEALSGGAQKKIYILSLPVLANGRATALLAESLLLPVLAQGRATALLGLLAVSFPLPVLAALILKLPPMLPDGRAAALFCIGNYFYGWFRPRNVQRN